MMAPEQGVAEAEIEAGTEEETGATVQVGEITEAESQEEQLAANAKLEEVLEELSEEMEVHAIGQEAEIKVEDELDTATLEEIGIPPTAAAASEAAAATQPLPQEGPDATSAEASPAAAAPAAAGDTRWVGNKRRMVAHPPGSTRLPAEANRVYFNSREEAIAAGYSVVEPEERQGR
jgi:hypothetical protein